MKFNLEEARRQDQEDSFKAIKHEFNMIENTIYMDGNSLGLFPKAAEENLLKVLQAYKSMGIDVWSKTNPPLFLYQDTLAELMAPIFGAKASEVTIHSNTTVNIYSLMATLYQPTETRKKILVDDLNFPTGRYTIESLLRTKGLNPEEVIMEVNSRDGQFLEEDAIIEMMTDEIAVIFLPAVLYRSGQLLDMKSLTQAAHEKGIIIGFDCSHSAGSVIHEFDHWDVDFAVWCTYKYLNSGPGANAALFLNEKHHHLPVGIQGWQGYKKDKQFDLLNHFDNVKDASGWQTGTQNILSMAPIEGALKLFHEHGMKNIREKSIRLTQYLIDLIEEVLSSYGFTIGTPKEPLRRGGHVALIHEEAIRINAALKDLGVLPDFRAPNVIRLAPVAFYVDYEDLYHTVRIIKLIMDEKIYEQYDNKRGTVA
ncbi:MAG: kynureninase [Clostridia bacterium]|nr:kynureninase [Clostridia bacterium]